MTRISRRAALTTGYDIKIGGRLISIYLAKMVYRCEECHSKLVIVGAGLKCEANQAHRGFLHRDEVAEIEEQQAQNVDALNEFYTIENGKVVIKDGN
jgi:hypothetical protein